MYKHLKKISAELAEDYPLTSQYVNGIYGLAKKLSFQMSTNRAVYTHEDFFQAMIVEACKLEVKFDESRGNSFYTFINRPLRAQMFKIFVAVDTGSDHYKTIKKFVIEYQKTHHLYPNVETISDGVDLPSDIVKFEFYGKSLEVSPDDMDEMSMSDEDDAINPMDFLHVLDPIELVVIELMFSEIPEELSEAFTIHYLMISKEALDEVMKTALRKLKEAIDESL